MVGFWLRSEYLAEQQNLQTYFQSVASKAAVQTQDSLVMFLMHESEKAKKSSHEARKELEKLLENRDKIHDQLNVETHVTRMELADTLVYYEFRTEKDSFDDVISLATELNGTISDDHELLISSIAERLNALLEDRNLEQQFQITTVDSVLTSSSKMATALMRNPVSGEQYKAVFTTTKWETLLAILPQIVFAFVLIVVVVGTLLFLKRGLTQKNRLLQLKEGFVSNMTHELKTPVATIGVALEAIKNHPTDAELSQEYLDISTAEVDRLSMLIDRVLKMSQFENDQLQLQLERVEMVPLLQEVTNLSKPMLKERKVELSSSINVPTDISVLGDKMHLTNMIFNLLDNSLKYCPKGSHIGQEIWVENDFVVFKHSDNGPGIPKAYHKEVFSRFFRVPTKNIHNVKGHGLGLSYVQQVVKMHKGTISMESIEEVGTSFIIKLPILHYG